MLAHSHSASSDPQDAYTDVATLSSSTADGILLGSGYPGDMGFSSSGVRAEDIFESLQDLSMPSTSSAGLGGGSIGIPAGGNARLATVELDELAGVLSPNAVHGLADLTQPRSFTALPTSSDGKIDPLTELIGRYFHRQERPMRNPALVAMSMDSSGDDDHEAVIAEMMRNRAWFALATYTEAQLTDTTTQASARRDVDALFRLWYCRVLALARLRLFRAAQIELDRLGDLDRPEFRYETHLAVPKSGSMTSPAQTPVSQHLASSIFPGRKGSMVPFELRVIHAQLPACQGEYGTSIERIYDLIIHCRRTVTDLEPVFDYLSRSYGVADDVMGEGGARSAAEVRDEINTYYSRMTSLQLLAARYLLAQKDFTAAATLLLRIEHESRDNAPILSSMGDITVAERALQNVAALPDAPAELITLNRGFLAAAHGDWEQSREAFAEVLLRQPGHFEASNNLALALLYQGKLDEAIRILEKRCSGAGQIAAFISPVPIMNLATLYELRTGDAGLLRKRELLRVMAEVCGDDLPAECFKLAI